MSESEVAVETAVVEFSLPSASASEEQGSAVLGALSTPSKTKIEAAGKWFEVLALRLKHSKSVLEADLDTFVKDVEARALDPLYSSGGSSRSGEKTAEEDAAAALNDDRFDKDEPADLFLLDPADWKKQDHYRVLGLSKLRWHATEEDIRQAFKRKVLIHHPDKKKGQKNASGAAAASSSGGGAEEEDNFFKCLKRANEILSDPVKRRSYDSVDPTFDDTVPEISEYNKKHFFAVFGPAMESNAHWFVKQPAPLLGGPDDSEDKVNDFYQFWYNEESWREFSYEDEEDKEKAENRDEKRWIEKQNKAARQKKKQAETRRFRQLIDNCALCDPRLARFKALEKEKKNAKKLEKQLVIQKEAEEKARVLREEQEAKERALKEAKENEEKAKKEKEEFKKQQRNQRKRFRNLCKDNGYFVVNQNDLLRQMEYMELLCEKLPLERLKALSDNIEQNKESGTAAFDEELARLRHEEQEAKANAANQQSWESKSSAAQAKEWAHDDIQLLVKAVKTYGPGSLNRWESVTEFMNHHNTTGSKFSTTEVISKAKELAKVGTSSDHVKEQVNKETLIKIEKKAEEAVVVEPTIKHDYDAPSTSAAADSPKAKDKGKAAAAADAKEDKGKTAAASAASSSSSAVPAEKKDEEPMAPWTAEEQHALEVALRAIPASDPARWDKVAEAVGTRSKKDCVRRFKELAELVKAKKAAK